MLQIQTGWDSVVTRNLLVMRKILANFRNLEPGSLTQRQAYSIAYLFVFGTTATSGPGPPHSQGF